MDFLLKGIFTLAILASASTTEVKHLCSGFLPKNDMQIGVHEKSLDGGLTQEEFLNVLREAKRAYAQTFEVQVGRPLVIYADWESPDVNAAATVEDGESILMFFGGLARHQYTTKDAFRLVVCHELGHHVGGSPKANILTQMAAEGQADYYGGIRCMKHLLKGQENIAILDDTSVPQTSLTACKNAYSTKEEQAICVRTQMAAQSLGQIMADVTNANVPSIDTPSQSVAARTIRGYPSTQCRLDTQIAGSMCSKVGGLVIDSSTNDPRGICLQGQEEIGFRPNCWYVPRTLSSIRTL